MYFKLNAWRTAGCTTLLEESHYQD